MSSVRRICHPPASTRIHPESLRQNWPDKFVTGLTVLSRAGSPTDVPDGNQPTQSDSGWVQYAKTEVSNSGSRPSPTGKQNSTCPLCGGRGLRLLQFAWAFRPYLAVFAGNSSWRSRVVQNVTRPLFRDLGFKHQYSMMVNSDRSCGPTLHCA